MTTEAPSVTAAQLVEMLTDLYNHNDPSRLRALAAPGLRHYSSAIGDGVDAWAAYAATFAGSSPLVAVHRTVREGDRIGVHAHYRWNPERVIDGGPGVAVAHIFTIEGGRIVEAVELTQAVVTETASGNDMFSQLGPSVDAQDPARNRETAKRVVTELLTGGVSLRDELLTDYTQHNPIIPNGVEGIAGFVKAIGGSPNDYRWTIVEGDLAWTYVRYRANPAIGTPDLVTVDIWRFAGDGRVTEHWDILEPEFTSPSGRTFAGTA